MFDKIKFQKFVTNKEFLADSYTAFKNKIGLTANGQYLTQSNEVVLDFPYKDCVLEGGQTKEEQKRQEIFWNQTLAPDEIDRLFEPKVLTNWKRYDRNGGHKVERISLDDNLIIKGNNLITLHSIKKVYRGKVKLIYIDPPYNTGRKADTFSYNNTFKRSTWLTFMKNRLEVSKDLLTDDGVICIAIDDHEYAHLKVLCDEIFDRENYIGTTVVRSGPGTGTDSIFFATQHEYCLFYAKNIELAKMYDLPKTDKQIKSYNKEDKIGKYALRSFIRYGGGASTPSEQPNGEFSIYYSMPTDKIIAIGGERTKSIDFPYQPKSIKAFDENNRLIEYNPDDYFEIYGKDIVEILPIDSSKKRRVWRQSDRLKILKSAREGELIASKNKDGKYSIQYKARINDGSKPTTIWYDAKYAASSYGSRLLKKLFNNEKVFSYPKSIHTVKDTIKIFSRPESSDIVLDFFAGSGTTGHAVLALNKEDGGNRKFILCEQMDYTEKVTSKRVQKVIESNHSGSFIYTKLATHNDNYLGELYRIDDKEKLNELFSNIASNQLLSYKVKHDVVNGSVLLSEFDAFSIDEKKKLLIELLDKNQIYINYSEIDDHDFQISHEDKNLTRQFYNE